MKIKKFTITVPGQKTGPASLLLYQIDNIHVAPQKKRPLVIVCGGGGYWHISDREKEPIVLQFLAMGCNACLLEYSVAPNEFPTSLLELASSVALMRRLAKGNAEEWNIDPDKIVTCGCSAGGHLAASLGVFWDKEFVYQTLNQEKDEGKPNGQILCYPVITSGEKAHRGSIEKLLGEKIHDPVLLEKISLEKQVTEHTPKTFLWHTAPDDTVPVENSLLFSQALLRAGVSCELHIYPKGGHGLSLCMEETSGNQDNTFEPYCSSWISLARSWMELNVQCLSMRE